MSMLANIKASYYTKNIIMGKIATRLLSLNTIQKLNCVQNFITDGQKTTLKAWPSVSPFRKLGWNNVMYRAEVRTEP